VWVTAVLPGTYTVQPPAKEDAGAVFAVVAAYNTAVVGFADYTLDDMVDELTKPGFEPETDGWLVFDGDTPVGYGWVSGKGDHHLLEMDVFTADPVVETYNPTPALDLYLSVGMRASLVIDVWRLEVTGD